MALWESGTEAHEIEAEAHSQPLGDYRAGMLSQLRLLQNPTDEPPRIRDYVDD